MFYFFRISVRDAPSLVVQEKFLSDVGLLEIYGPLLDEWRLLRFTGPPFFHFFFFVLVLFLGLCAFVFSFFFFFFFFFFSGCPFYFFFFFFFFFALLFFYLFFSFSDVFFGFS